MAGEWIRPKEVRSIQKRQQEHADERMREAGIEPVGGNIAELGEAIYGPMSESAHHRRGGFPEAIARSIRSFAYGPHPDPERRAGHLNFAGELLEEVVIVVGAAFSDIILGNYFVEVVKPLQAEMERVRAEQPLP